MAKGYKVSSSAAPRATMRQGSPMKSGLLSKASSGMPKIPAVRPTWKRNQKPAPAGFKPGRF